MRFKEVPVARETMAVISVGALLGASIGFATAFRREQVAGKDSIAAEACMQNYYGQDFTITKSVINCMQEGWVPGVSISNFPSSISVGAPGQLVEAYAAEEDYLSSNFDVAEPIFWGLGGLILAGAGAKVLTRGSSDPPPKGKEPIIEDDSFVAKKEDSEERSNILVLRPRNRAS